MKATCERLRRSHGKSGTLLNMVRRLHELKSSMKKEKKREKLEGVNESHGVNDVLREDMAEERVMDTVQMKGEPRHESREKDPSHPVIQTLVKHPPAKPVVVPQSATPSQRPASPEAYIPPKPRLPPQPVTGGNGVRR